MDRAFALHDGTLGMLLVFSRVALDHLGAFHDHALLVTQYFEHFTAFAAFRARDNHDLIALFDMALLHTQITSGASEIIFMNFRSRNSRATGPKMRVPRGLFSLSMITMALLSKRKYEPSLRRMACLVRTTTALQTSPFFTVPSGEASLIWTLITSPIPAYIWFLPNTPIAAARLAPVLS